jgi:hypothetical protein
LEHTPDGRYVDAEAFGQQVDGPVVAMSLLPQHGAQLL